MELDKGESCVKCFELQEKLEDMERKVLQLENEIQVLKQSNKELEKSIQNGEEDDDALGTHLINTPPEEYMYAEGFKRGEKSEVDWTCRKRLEFDIDGSRQDKKKWESIEEMPADVYEKPELCMRAICALWCRQTPEERSCKATICSNRRGFSWDDVYWASSVAEFLTDGDPKSDIKKSLKQLEQLEIFKPDGLQKCERMASFYQKQLFGIYETEEDSFFFILSNLNSSNPFGNLLVLVWKLETF